MSPVRRRTTPGCRIGLSAALIVPLAALVHHELRGASLGPNLAPCQAATAHAAESCAGRAGPSREAVALLAARVSDLRERPERRCLECHRQGDHRIDPSKRTAYASFAPIAREALPRAAERGACSR